MEFTLAEFIVSIHSEIEYHTGADFDDYDETKISSEMALKIFNEAIQTLSAFVCLDCKVDTSQIDEYYMVSDKVWNSVCEAGMLCIGCLETRVGRELNKDDFTECPLNSDNLLGASERLKDRLTRKA